GDRRPVVSESLVGLLYAQGEMDQAEKELASLGSVVNQSPRLARIAIAIKNRRGDSESAMALARRQVADRPNDPMSHIVLGQALRKAGDFVTALGSFQQATKVAPSDLRSWQALFGYHLERGDRAAAREALSSLTKLVELPQRDMLLL